MALPVADTREATSCGGVIKRRGGGPKLKPIDLTELEKLCALHCTQQDIASWFHCDTNTIERRIASQDLWDHEGEKLTFRQIMDRGYARGRISLRRKQMQLAEQGNATMLVWLGKQILGQKDTVEQQITGSDGKPLQIEIVRVAVDRNREIEEDQFPATLPSPLRPV